MNRGLFVGTAVALVIGGVTPVVSTVGVDTATAGGAAAIPSDFDGDGFADLAVGVPLEDVRGRRDAGAVQVLYGSAQGVTARDQLWHQGSKGIKGALERRDRFGDALASGDFDRDGYADLAIGVPSEDVGRIKNAGIVQVLYGGRSGLTARDQTWRPGKAGIPGSSENQDGFGSGLAVGDFNGDSYADLAIEGGQGGPVVISGSASGLTSAGARTLGGGTGGGMAAGDVNGDGKDELAVLVGLNTSGVPGSGIRVLLGSPSGVTAIGGQYIVAADLGLPQDWIVGDLSLADFDGDGLDDLAISSNIGSATVSVLHGHADGFHLAPLPAAGMPGEDATWAIQWWNEHRGPPMAAGDFTGDGRVDLAVDTGGPVAVILGAAAGLGTAVVRWPVNVMTWTHLAALPLSAGSHDWLVVGNYEATVGGDDDAGIVSVLRGTPDGSPGPTTVWSQDSPGIRGAAERGDGFGMSLGS